MNRFSRLLIIAIAMFVLTAPLFAAPMPSKTAANQSLDARAADLAVVERVASIDSVSKALTAQGLTQEQVQQRLASLSDQDLHNLAQNVDQLQAAGLTRSQWTWILVGAVAALILVAVL